MTGQSPALPNRHPTSATSGRSAEKVPEVALTHRWQHVHLTLAHPLDAVPTVELRTYADPRDAVAQAKLCGPDGCCAGCRRARAAGLRSYVRQAS